MKKFVLISCCERDINKPRLFNSLGEATQAMLDELKTERNLTDEEIEELVDTGECQYDDTGVSVTGFSAWTTTSWHNNIDWQIFEMEF